MSKIDLTADGSAVTRGSRRIIDLTQSDMRQLHEAVMKAFAGSVNFKFSAEMADSNNYRAHFDMLYRFVAKFAQIGFGQEFEPDLMSRITIEEFVLPDGELTFSFKYYSALKSKTFKIKFRGPSAPITTTWPKAMIHQGGPAVLLEKFQHV